MCHNPDDDWWAEAWLERTYSGAPDECNTHWPTKLRNDGSCPDCEKEKQQ